jgi:hypothetical protein
MSYLNDYIKPTDYGAVRKDINRILSLIHDITAQEPEDEGLQERICISSNVKLRTSNFDIGKQDLQSTDIRNKETFLWSRKKPTSVSTYDLVNTTTGSGFTYPVSATWDGARVDNDGTTYITINDHTDFDFTDELTIAMKVILPSSVDTESVFNTTLFNNAIFNTPSGGFVLCEKVNEYRLRVVDTNTLEFAIYTGGSYSTPLTYSYTPDTAFTIVATYNYTGSGQKLYINGILSDSDSVSGSINNSTGDFCLMATAGGTNIVKSGTSMARFSILNKEVDTTWITNYNTNSRLDTSDGNNEITTIPFTGDDVVNPDATLSEFVAS